MRPYILLFLFSLHVLSCEQKKSLVRDVEVISTQNDAVPPSPYKEYILDTNKIAIIQNSTPSNFFLGLKLTNTDLKEIDSLLNLAVDNYNGSGSLVYTPRSLKLENYKRQYSPFLDSGKDKIVSIQCFCEDFDTSDYWKKNILQISDGGSCVFWLQINLTKKTFEKIRIHGSA